MDELNRMKELVENTNQHGGSEYKCALTIVGVKDTNKTLQTEHYSEQYDTVKEVANLYVLKKNEYIHESHKVCIVCFQSKNEETNDDNTLKQRVRKMLGLSHDHLVYLFDSSKIPPPSEELPNRLQIIKVYQDLSEHLVTTKAERVIVQIQQLQQKLKEYDAQTKIMGSPEQFNKRINDLFQSLSKCRQELATCRKPK